MPVRRTGGFTLIELMVALVVTGILATVILQLLLGQSRFARLQTAREEVQQNARAALDVISSDLRAIGDSAIIAAGETLLSFYVPRAWGIVCQYESSLGGMAVVFPGEASSTFQDETDSLAVVVKPTLLGSPTWQFLEVQDLTSEGTIGILGITISASACESEIDPEGVTETRLLQSGDLVLKTVEEGSDVYLVEQVRYATGDPATPGLEGTWLLRSMRDPSTGTVSMQPLAGPLAEDGLTFQYYDAAGTLIDPATLASPVVRNSIRRVEVKVVMESRTEFGGQPQQDTDSTLVYLRNRGP